MRHVIIIGPQGAGKGTQAARIAPRFGLVHLSTGDLFRALMKEESDLADEVRGYVEQGDLVPDNLTARVLFDALDRAAAGSDIEGALFDGYPRNRAQAEVLDRVIADRGEDLVGVVHLTVPTDVLLERIRNRAEIEGRVDDTPEAIERRLNIYFRETEPLIDMWRERSIVLDIDGNQTMDEVTDDTISALSRVLSQAGKA